MKYKTGDIRIDIGLLFDNERSKHFEIYGTKDGKLSMPFDIEEFVKKYENEYKTGQLLGEIASTIMWEEKEEGMLTKDFYCFGKYEKLLNVLIEFKKDPYKGIREEKIAKDKLYELCKNFINKMKILNNKHIYENDVLDTSSGFIEEMCEIVGYAKNKEKGVG